MKRNAILIGLGRIGWSLEKDKLRYHPCTHAGSLLALKRRYNLIAVCDTNPARIQEFQRWWPEPVLCFENPKQLFASINSAQFADQRRKSSGKESNAASTSTTEGPLSVDLAIVATPQDVHTSQALELMKSGVADVLIEKPPGEKASDAKKLLQAMENFHRRLWINFERRYHPGYQKVLKLIQSKSLGTLRHIRGRVYSGASPVHPGSGPLLHDAVHWIDLLFWYCGIPINMSGRIVRNSKGLEQASHLHFHYDNFVANLDTGARSKFFEFEMELDFSDGRIHCGNNGFRLWKSRKSSRYSGFKELKEYPFSFSESKRNPWMNMYSTIAREAHISSGKASESGYDRNRTIQGLKTVEFIDKAYRTL